MAKKDAYYFSHDANAQDDPKCMMLIDQMGLEGYGIFWALIEKLRSEAEYKLPISILQSFAKRWGTSKEKVEVVVKSYSLFEIEDDYFFSPRLIRSMKLKSEKARLSANYRWNNANALQSDSERIANGMRNDAIKGKESKEKEIESKGNEIDYEKKFETEQCIQICLLDQQWREKVKPKDNELREFVDHLISTGDTLKNPKDFKSHFYHWRNKQKPEEKGLVIKPLKA